MHSKKNILCAIAGVCASVASAQTIAEINGINFLSPLQGQAVTNVTGLVTGVASNAVWIRSLTPDNDTRTSESIEVFSSSLAKNVSVGDILMLDGNVAEFRSDPTVLFLTEIEDPINVQILSSGNTVTPLVIGKDTTQPPNLVYTSLDEGNVFGVPGNVSQISVVNPVLQPLKYGMDFWESLSGELVKVHIPVALDKPNSFGDTWVVGNWKVTGLNSRGGITLTSGDGNPEAILIQTPLDGTDNPLGTKLGDTMADITGVITYAFGSYTIRPRTAIRTIRSQLPVLPPATTLAQSGGCRGLTIGDYNMDNFAPGDPKTDVRAMQIVNDLGSPSIMFLQEIQDNDGATDDGVVAATKTLKGLVKAILQAGGPRYEFITINPIDDTTGGEPGGNIRNAYIYNPKVVQLTNLNPGTAIQANGVLPGPHLKFNPGFIAPNNSAFLNSRRPLAAQWHTLDGGNNKFFTVNMHDTSKDGSSSLFGDLRPPINLGVDQRDAQTTVVAAFVTQLLKADPMANIIVAGDFNEYGFVEPQLDFVTKSGLSDLDVVVGLAPVERYSYLFDQSSEALDHMYVSPRIASKGPQQDRVHANSWVSFDDEASDHDPTVGKFNVCK